MGIQVDNRVSWLDIVAIAGMILTGSLVFFDVKEDVALNAQKIDIVEAELSEEIHRVENEADNDRKEILETVKDNGRESALGIRRVEDKLDRLIERKLDEN